ncbi:MAG: hypothetical protein JWM02_47 [Frankiales bacterium]|nr:hypothetical protein [Frankiales bacterium]
MKTTERTVCVRCTAPYLASLTRYRCPVCDSPTPGHTRRTRAWEDPDDRLMAVVALATIGNVLLLAVLTVFVLS